ncbi:hypothetical protein ITX31_06890 [Arthrobacter gandavensis]|uniref:hypothetical protein n=1 Tax=Arthrobacter gandavensis TaxID=169960 RepID=UPI00188E052F|nr:hypothetical protein [Arthrobacter gandavensis]MBF4993836.1 hypothetical protein [Arthrobacter gandavensis]
MQIPSGWEASQAGAEALVLAPSTGGFRPSLTLRTRPFEGTAGRAATQEIAGVLAALESPQVLSWNLWPYSGAEGRWIEYTYETSEAVLHVQQWFHLRDGLLTTCTATCRTSQLPAYDNAFSVMAGSVAATEGTGDE